MKSAEKAILDRAPDGVTNHDMGTGWRVIVAKCGEHHATWYYHVNDDQRIAAGCAQDARRRFALWATLESARLASQAASSPHTPDPDYLREDRDERRRLDREDAR